MAVRISTYAVHHCVLVQQANIAPAAGVRTPLITVMDEPRLRLALLVLGGMKGQL